MASIIEEYQKLLEPHGVKVKFMRVGNHDYPLPDYQHPGDAGMDLRSIESNVALSPGMIHLFSTGYSIAIPSGCEGQVRSRSGLACKHGICVVNSPGTIDSNYRGEVKVGLINLSKDEFIIEPGMRIAQLVISPIISAKPILVESLDATERKGGFGSTGLN